MQYALVNGNREAAKPKLAGLCLICGNKMIAKCGSKVIWHWAHETRKHCDPWWENETDWHRTWKACFPEPWREQVHHDSSGEKHIADVETPNGTVIEFQNSPIPPDELQSRENFYGRIIWIVNGSGFLQNFHVLGRLPKPDAECVKEIVFVRQRRDWYGRAFWRKSENPHAKPEEPNMVKVHSTDKIQAEIDKDYIGHHLYDWLKPRAVWLEAKALIYIDFGGDLLWLLSRYDDRGLHCVQAVRKTSVIQQHGGSYINVGKTASLPGRVARLGAPIDNHDCDVLLNLIP